MSADFVIQFGKLKGKKLGDVPRDEISSYISWLENNSNGKASPNLDALKAAFLAMSSASEAPKPQEPARSVSGRKPSANKNDPYKGANATGNTIRTFATKLGTELPLLNLKGKEYLEVKFRLVWFREENPAWSIETEYVTATDKSALAKATIRDDSGRILATSHKQENIQHFNDFLEKAETGAIGRALALLGYGTQFCADELDEGSRIVDAPVGHGKHPSEPEVPTVENGPVVVITLKGRNKDVEAMLKKNGFTYDWASSSYLRYYDERFDFDSLGVKYEIVERPAAFDVPKFKKDEDIPF